MKNYGGYYLKLSKQTHLLHAIPGIIDVFTVLRSSHATGKNAKNALIFHTHYNFVSLLQQFFNSFLWATIFTIFLEQSLQYCVRGPLHACSEYYT